MQLLFQTTHSTRTATCFDYMIAKLLKHQIESCFKFASVDTPVV